MSTAIHIHCLDIAKATSAPLHDAMHLLGPQQLYPRQDKPLAEVLCRSVAGQQLSVKAASTIWSRVLALCSEQTVTVALHQAPTDALRGCGLSAAKTRAIKGIVEASYKGELDERSLSRENAQTRSKVLQQLWGVGEWTADMINMFYFQETDIWPTKDVTARKTLLRLTGHSEQADSAEVAAPFAPYRSYLAMYMYTYVDANPQT